MQENDITASIDNDTYRCNRSSHNVDLKFKCFRCHESCGKQLQAARKAIRKAWCKSCNTRDIHTKVGLADREGGLKAIWFNDAF